MLTIAADPRHLVRVSASPPSSTPGFSNDASPAYPHDRSRWRYLTRWRAVGLVPRQFLLPVRVLAKLFRRRFLASNSYMRQVASSSSATRLA